MISGLGFLYGYAAAVIELVVASVFALAVGSGEPYGLPSVYALQIGIAFACVWQLVFMFVYTVPNLDPRPGPPLPAGENYLVYSLKTCIGD